MDFITETKGKIKAQKQKNKSNKLALLGIAGIVASASLNSCITPASSPYVGYGTNYGQTITQTVISPDGLQKTTTRVHNQTNIIDQGRYMESVARSLRTTAEAYSTFKRAQFQYRR